MCVNTAVLLLFRFLIVTSNDTHLEVSFILSLFSFSSGCSWRSGGARLQCSVRTLSKSLSMPLFNNNAITVNSLHSAHLYIELRLYRTLYSFRIIYVYMGMVR